jgi:hypothetical protein
MIHLISFHTCGNPYDNASDYTDICKTFVEHYSKYFSNITIYNTKTFENDVYFKTKILTTHPRNNIHSEHIRGEKHGYWRWKPYIILQKLLTLNYNDILIYQDINVKRYPYYLENIDQYQTIVENLFSKIQSDVLVAVEDLNLPCEKHVKSDVFKEIGTNDDLYRDFPLLHACRIFIKKTKISMMFVREWLKYCETDLILPEIIQEDKLRWHTHDQAILTVLYIKYIELGFFSSNAPGFHLRDKKMSTDNVFIIPYE